MINARKTKKTKKLIVLCLPTSISQPLDLSHGYHRLQPSGWKPSTHSSSSSLPMSSPISSSSHVSLCSLFSFTTLTWCKCSAPRHRVQEPSASRDPSPILGPMSCKCRFRRRHSSLANISWSLIFHCQKDKL